MQSCHNKLQSCATSCLPRQNFRHVYRKCEKCIGLDRVAIPTMCIIQLSKVPRERSRDAKRGKSLGDASLLRGGGGSNTAMKCIRVACERFDERLGWKLHIYLRCFKRNCEHLKESRFLPKKNAIRSAARSPSFFLFFFPFSSFTSLFF